MLTPLLPAPRVPAGLTFWRAHTAVAHARVACVRACVRRSFSRRVFALRVSKMIGYYDRFLLFCLSVVGYCFISGISGCLTTTGGKRKRRIETSVLSLFFFSFLLCSFLHFAIGSSLFDAFFSSHLKKKKREKITWCGSSKSSGRTAGLVVVVCNVLYFNLHFYFRFYVLSTLTPNRNLAKPDFHPRAPLNPFTIRQLWPPTNFK